MKEINPDYIVTPLPLAVAVETVRRSRLIGLPAGASATEKRFPLTPEGVEALISMGYEVIIETGAAASINYSDQAYERAGATIGSRAEALGADIVIHLPVLPPTDIRRLKRGAMLLSLLHAGSRRKEQIEAMTRRGVVFVAVDLITDRENHTPFYDILAEVDGRAALALSSALLARPEYGKGILLGGVAGVVPCEVTVIGSGLAAEAAASSAMGLGAMVRVFDNNVYRLRRVESRRLRGAVTSALNPHVLANALRSADVVIATDTDPEVSIGSEMVEIMKKGVIVIDLTAETRVFPSLPALDITDASLPRPQGRTCYRSVGNLVPRTAAMAVTDAFLRLFADIAAADSAVDAVRFIAGLQHAAVTFLGKVVNPAVARAAGCRCIDINLLLNCC